MSSYADICECGHARVNHSEENCGHCFSEFCVCLSFKPASNPPPVPNAGTPIWDLVIADMNARDRIGRQRYGTPLQAHNGRDALRDAYEEALDLAVYLRQEIEERKAGALMKPITLAEARELALSATKEAEDGLRADRAKSIDYGQDLAKDAMGMLRCMSANERMEFFSACRDKFCPYCGCVQPKGRVCQCANDQ